MRKIQREKMKVIVGGSAVAEEFSKSIGVEGRLSHGTWEVELARSQPRKQANQLLLSQVEA